MSLQRSREWRGRWRRGGADSSLIRRRALVGGRPDGSAHGASVAGESEDVIHVVDLDVLGLGPECPVDQRRSVVVVGGGASRERAAGTLAGGAADGAGKGGVGVREGVVSGRHRRVFVCGFAREGAWCRYHGGASVAGVAARAAVLDVIEAVLEHVGVELGFCGGGAQGRYVLRGGVAAVEVEGRVDAAGTAGGGHEAAWVDVAV